MTVPEKLEQRYEGKAKKVYATCDPELYLVEYKDDATAFNAQKRGQIAGKGAVNNAVSAKLFTLLGGEGVETHFVKRLSEREQLVRAVTIIPLEVVVRPYAAGSFAKRYGVDEGVKLEPTVLEWCLKSDALGDPPLNGDTVLALGLASADDLNALRASALHIGALLSAYFAKVQLKLIDFKLEFGRLTTGEVVLADEISPDTCRLWDAKSGERLDKDRFRRDLGGVERLPGGRAAGAGGAVNPVNDETKTTTYKAEVEVLLKRAILDPQGRAVETTLHRLGTDNVADVRIGKHIELTLTGEQAAVEAQLERLIEQILSNPVLEEATYTLTESSSVGANSGDPENSTSPEHPAG